MHGVILVCGDLSTSFFFSLAWFIVCGIAVKCKIDSSTNGILINIAAENNIQIINTVVRLNKTVH